MEQTQKDCASGQKKEVVIISPEELRKLGITKTLDMTPSADSSSESTSTNSPKLSTVKTSPIVLNAQVSRHYMKTVYGSMTPDVAPPRSATLAKKSFPQPLTITLSTTKKLLSNKPPDVLNSKVCPPIREVITPRIAQSVENAEICQLKLEHEDDEEMIDLDSSRDDGPPSPVQVIKMSPSESLEILDSDGEDIEGEKDAQTNDKQPKNLINVISIASVQLPQHAIRDLVSSSDRISPNISSTEQNSSNIVSIKPKLEDPTSIETNQATAEPSSPDTSQSKVEKLTKDVKTHFESITSEKTLSQNLVSDEVDAECKVVNEAPINEESSDSGDEPQESQQDVASVEQSPPSKTLHAPSKEILLDCTDEIVIIEDKIPKKRGGVISCANEEEILIARMLRKSKNSPLGEPIQPSRTFKAIRVYSKKSTDPLSEPSNVFGVEDVNKDLSPLELSNKVTVIKAQIRSVIKNVAKRSNCSVVSEKIDLTDDGSEEDASDTDISPSVKKRPQERRRKLPPIIEQMTKVEESCIDDPDASIETPVIKKKRGRRKNSNAPIEDKSWMDTSDPTVVFVGAAEVPKRVSRTPRKAARISYRELEEDEVPQIPEKNAGRSNKVLLSPNPENEGGLKEEDKDRSITTEPEAGKQVYKKKPGRPKKMLLSPNSHDRAKVKEEEEQIDAEHEDEKPTPKRRPGRPKKIILSPDYHDEAEVKEEEEDGSIEPDHDDREPVAKKKTRRARKTPPSRNIRDEDAVQTKDKRRSTDAEDKDGERSTSKEKEMETPGSTAKKRGRPRKQPLDPEKVNVKVEKSPPIAEIESSKSGRKRKRVDYFAMENSFYEVEYNNMNSKRSQHGQEGENGETVPSEAPKRGRRGRKPKSKTSDFDKTVSSKPKRGSKAADKIESEVGEGSDEDGGSDEESFLSKSLELSQSVTSDVQNASDSGAGRSDDFPGSARLAGANVEEEVGILRVNVGDLGLTGNESVESESALLNTTDECESEQILNYSRPKGKDRNTDKVGKKRYEKTGQTKAMIQNVFSAAMKTICDSDEEGQQEKQTQQPQAW